MNDRIAIYRNLWSLDLDGPPVDTFSSVIVFGRKADRSIVLKLPKPHSDESAQGEALRTYGGNGAVRMIDATPEAMLLECIAPGRSLSELVFAGRDEEATRIYCSVVRQLHSSKNDLHGFRPIRSLVAGFDRCLASGQDRIKSAEIRAARELFVSLAASQSSAVLLHGDLHHYNILYDQHRGWLAIDPKGYVGEPECEIAALLRNPMSDARYFASKEIIQRRVRITAQELGLDRERILSWAYTQELLSVIWSIEDGNREQSLDLTRILRGLI